MNRTLRERLEFAAVWSLVRGLGGLPRPAARMMGRAIGNGAYWLFGRLRQVGSRNLQLAFPDAPERERNKILRGSYRNLGSHLAEFCLMSKYTARDASSFIEYEGLEHFLNARSLGKGVLIVTGHLGAWELSSFYHSLMGHPMGLVIRRLDNPLVDAFVNRIRCLHGNRIIAKSDFARGLISAMNAGETVGILMDTNMTPPQGVFVPFFGRDACTASGLARIALKTDAAVVSGFLLWHEARQKYVLTFGPRIPLVRTGNTANDVLANTAAFTQVIEAAVRRHPEQWLWMHRRWKTRPAGEARIY